MSQQDIPTEFNDHNTLLSESGFASSNTWYHGTTSGLVSSILQNGIQRSGDVELNKAIKHTMATIGNSYNESKQPVFITQSKSLAYYWANKKTHSRNMQLAAKNEGKETPAVIEMTLPDELQDQVKTDVGAAAFLLTGTDEYVDYVNALYSEMKLEQPNIDPMTADRMDYQNKLGMAYINKDIPAEYVKEIKA